MFTWNRRRLLIVALIVVGLITINFAFRAFQHGRRFRARMDEPIQMWMNIPYIARAYRVDPWALHDALGLTPNQRDPRPLREIAQEQGRSSDQVIADVMAAIERERAAQRPPDRPRPPDGPPPPAESPPPSPESQS